MAGFLLRCGLIFVLLASGSLAWADLSDGICFYLPFDGDAKAMIAKGNPMEMAEGINAVFVPGKVGNAIHCGEGGRHRYLSYLTVSLAFAPNICAQAGTLAFWVRPDWDGDDPVDRYRHFVSIRSGLFYLYWHRGGIVFSSTMRQLARHLYAPSADVRNWHKGEWHQLAVTWQRTDPKGQKGFKRIYVDGQKVGEVNDVILDFDLKGALIIGGLDGEPHRIADAAIDEFAVWERALSDAEIEQLYQLGTSGKALALLPSVQNLAQKTRRQISPPIPPQKGNLLANASFEVGCLHPWRASNMTLQPDPKEKVHGRQSARILVRQRATLTSGLFRARPQIAHTLSLWLKANREGVKVRFGVYSAYVAGTQPYEPIFRGVEREALLTTDWQRYTVTGVLPPSPQGYYFVRLSAETPSPSILWVDAAQLEEGQQATPFRLRRAFEVGLTTDKPFHAFHPDEPVRLRIEAFGDGWKDHRLTLQVTVNDVWEQVVWQRPLTVSFKAKPKATLTLSLQLPLGSFRVAVVDGKGEVQDELIVAMLPRFEQADERMGTHVSADETGVTLAKLLGCRWVRLLDACSVTHWNIVEPERGKWAWQQGNWIDEAIDTYRRAGLKVLGLLFRTPTWASSGETVNHPPKDLQAWRTYVRVVAEHFKGRIDAYEVWNEPYGLGLFTGKEDLYLQMVRTAYEELRKVDPQALIVAPCTYWTLSDVVAWTEKLLQKGLVSFVDVFSFHGYEGYRPDDFERVRHWSTTDGQRRPIWNTEQGVVSESFYRFLADADDDPYTRWIATQSFPARQAAAALVKAFVSSLAAGCEKFFQYWAVPEDTMLPRLKSMSLLEFDNVLRPKAAAWAIAGWLLRDCQPDGFERSGNLWQVHFRKGDQRITVAWSEEGTATILLPDGTQALTMMGNPALASKGRLQIGYEPVYILLPASKGGILMLGEKSQ